MTFRTATSRMYRILCVDDEIIGARIRAEILEEHGYSVALYDCPLAVLRCDLSIFDLAVLDFQMPGLNGRELFLRMRASGARFPIVLLTACMDALSYEERVLFARCLDKRMPIQCLLDTIAEFLDPNQVPDYSCRGNSETLHYSPGLASEVEIQQHRGRKENFKWHVCIRSIRR